MDEHEAHRQAVRQAERQHDEHRKQITAMLPSVITFAAEALKSAALINGGAAAATLALISQIIDDKKSLAANMISSLRLFGIGLLLAVAAAGASYFSQLSFQAASVKAELIWEYPFVKPNSIAQRWQCAGLSFQVIGILLVLSSYILALIGFLLAANALSSAVK